MAERVGASVEWRQVEAIGQQMKWVKVEFDGVLEWGWMVFEIKGARVDQSGDERYHMRSKSSWPASSCVEQRGQKGLADAGMVQTGVMLLGSGVSLGVQRLVRRGAG